MLFTFTVPYANMYLVKIGNYLKNFTEKPGFPGRFFE